MSGNRSFKRLIALVLAVGAVGVGVAVGGVPVAAGDSGQSGSVAHGRGYPNAVPPILARESVSRLAALEAFEAVEFFSDPPANARYSNAEMNAYASTHK